MFFICGFHLVRNKLKTPINSNLALASSLEYSNTYCSQLEGIMTGITSWGNLSDELSKANDNEFKEKVISLLRVLNPSFNACWDIPEADFIVKSDEGKFIWVVQCQIFDSNCELLESHANQIYLTIQAFISQGYTCDRYWVLHNHQDGNKSGKFTDFLDKIEEFKDNLISLGIMNEFLVLQRQRFLQIIEKEFKVTLINLFQKYSDRYRLDIEEKLEFGRYYISEIPVEEYDISFKEFNPLPDIKKVKTSNSQGVSSLAVYERKDVRWTLMHGEAGAGKTTTALHAAMAKSRTVLFINCDILDFHSLHSGTNFLLEHILRSLKILDEQFEHEKDRELLYSLSGGVLSKIIENSDEHILVFDGLDENRFYSDPRNAGLKKLSDRLANFHCPIILVTRTAHFEEVLFSELVTISRTTAGRKARKKAIALKLPQWTKFQSIQLIDRILESEKINLNEDKYKRIERLKKIIIDESYADFYGELPLNPLFLQFILSDVAERDIHRVNRATLIYQWVRQKIYRDFQKENRSFIVEKKVFGEDLFDLIDKVLYVMEITSIEMTIKGDNSTFDLREFTESDRITYIASKVFQVDKVQIIDLLLNSVLTSHATLTRDKYRSTKNRVTFSFRILQEYFLACFLVRNSKDVAQYPNSVKSFYEEIIKTDLEDELWMYLNKGFDKSEAIPFANDTLLQETNSISQGVTIVADNPVFNIYQQYSTIGVGVATEGSKTSFIQHVKQTINLPENDLVDAAQKIQDLLIQIAKTHPTTDNANQQTFIRKFIESLEATPELVKVLLAGGIEGIKVLCPPAGIPVEVARRLYESLKQQHKS
jgi:DNA polymerase III delta prime subunit